MHRLPKIISHSLNRRKNRASATTSSRQSSDPRRLDRSYAFKNIDYDLSPSTPASSSSHASGESLRGPSRDLCGGRTSLRVDGTDGEFEFICQTYGFSGIDDFAISPEEYEAMKVRSSSASVVFSQNPEPVDYLKIEGSDLVSKNSEESRNNFDCTDRIRADAFASDVSELSKRLGDGTMINDVIYNDNVSGRNGIKGLQPQILVPPPLVCSNWDPSIEFVLESDRCVLGSERGICLDEDGEGGPNRSEQEKVIRSYVPLESCSFTTTSNDDDSSSTTTEPMLSVSPKFRHVIEDWQKGELLGRGSFGSVYEGIADDGFFFAVKEVSLLDQGDEGKQSIIQLEQEIALLRQFEHENIVRYYGTMKDASHLYIFLELVTKGSLLSLYQKYDLRAPQVSAYTRQILHGLKYLHNRNVVHRDIKCANILVESNGLVKLADFGLAKAVKLNDAKSCKGTAFWMAPEVVRSQGYGLAADIWSLGCTVLEMLTRRFPYSDFEWMSALYKIGKGERPFIPDSLPTDARDFILKCLQVDAALRPTATQLLDHPFVKRQLTSASGAASPHSFGRQF
ncbi:mitogen-activated protein kinase kinase kinase 1 [Phtheirospermum japonicum]|uniref:mitogen-activated protein kinase kinase kinase n=1 Tax=Phtheirospermum japonicum TaxID=374723 RepID=A0A830C006_9LAMI|nr:mitogen-activated protein kinase kinase kinase 1 [Phtheirospermum japonicum]